MDVLHARARRSVPDGQEDSDQPSWEGVVFAGRDEMMTRIFWERIFEFYGESKEYYETHRHGAQWIVDNICKPKKEFLEDTNQSNGLIGSYYPDSSCYDKFMKEPRKGLLSGFPVEEVLYNPGISNNGRNDFDKFEIIDKDYNAFYCSHQSKQNLLWFGCYGQLVINL